MGRVVIGMLDPNRIVRGLGFRKLRQANIKTDVFPHDLMSQVEALNRDFVRAIENNPIHQTTQEIAVLASKSKHDRQREAVSLGLELCAGYFGGFTADKSRSQGRKQDILAIGSSWLKVFRGLKVSKLTFAFQHSTRQN